LTSTIIVGTGAPLFEITGSNQHLVDVAPPPVFARLEGPHYGMLGCVEVGCGVAVGTLIAAADVTTNQALSEVYPRIARLQTVFTTLRRWLHIPYLVCVVALPVEHLH
jgi:hypothetical protein